MKKYLSVFLILFTLCLTSNVSAYDFDVNVGDQVIWAGDYVGNGGEFTWTLLDDGGDRTDFSWSSFCVETSQTIRRATPYTVTGISDTTTSGATLTNEVAWLYWNFSNNTLDGYNSSSTTSQMALQNLIWDGLNQDDSYFSWRRGVGNQMDTWLEMAETAIQGGWTNDGLVQILNLGGAQDQLIAANPVPEPASMCLLGIGLIGLAVVGRKKIQHQTMV
ncbi:PEP-CTERM sorting domain-containing protein [Desulfocicer niacini]